MQAHQSLIRTYSDRKYVHTAMVRHKGTLVAVAMDSSRCIYYSVLNLDERDDKKGELDVNYWNDNPTLLPFASELCEVGYSVAGNTPLPTVKKGGRVEDQTGMLLDDEIDPVLSSTARLTALEQFTVLSDGAYIYLFRQSISPAHADAVYIRKNGQSSGDASRTDYVKDSAGAKVALVDNTLLCDRFVMVGSALKPMMEVRYQRSRHKTTPASAKDSLGTQDLDGRTFYEPTQALRFIHHLDGGKFAVQLLPTQIQDSLRWQIFAYNRRTQRIDSFNIERALDGLFNTQGSRFYTSPDPHYQSAVFERNPGKCPFTGRDLVPIVSESRFAETALAFAGGADYVEVAKSEVFSGQSGAYAVGVWVKPEKVGGTLLSRAAENGDSAVQLRIETNGTVTLLHGAGRLQSSHSLPFDDYTHVAVSYDQKSQQGRIYLNGELVASGELGYVPASGPLVLGALLKGGTASQGFAGTIDEVRIWDRLRSVDEILAEMKYRLIGNEPGLVAYYRFDAGQGSVLYDQTDYGCHGALRGSPKWVTSAAPIGENPGVHRDSFTLAGRAVETGMAAKLYFMQVDSSSGYDGKSKPQKQQARVLLTFAASGAEADGSATQRQHVAAIDFAVGRDGRLAQAPDVITLPTLGADNPNVDVERTSKLEEEVRTLVGAIRTLRSDIDSFVAGGGREQYEKMVALRDQLEQRVAQLEAQYNYEKNAYWNYWFAIYNDNQGKYLGVASNSGADGASILWSYDNSQPYCTHWRFSQADGSWHLIMARHSNKVWDVSGGRKWDGTPINQWTNYNVGWHRHFRLISQQGQDIGSGSVLRIEDIEQTKFAFQVRHSGSWAGVQGQALTQYASNSWPFNYSVRLQKLTLISGVDVQLDAARSELAKVRSQIDQLLIFQRNSLEELKRQLASKLTELSEKEAELAKLSSGTLGSSVSHPAPVLYTDLNGLTVTGGLLLFAHTTNAPMLFDSATGNVVLYFRGEDGQFYAAYYDTNSSVASLSFAVAPGQNLQFLGRTPGVDLGTTSITVSDGATADHCTVTIVREGVSEIFPDVPRAPAEFALVLNGQVAPPMHVGTIKESASPAATLTLEEGCRQSLAVGTRIHVNGLDDRLAVAAKAGSTELKLTTPLQHAVAGSSVEALTYDYCEAQSNRPGVKLNFGSNLLYAYPSGVSAAIPNGTATSSAKARACGWRGDAPGRAFELDGRCSVPALPGPQSVVSTALGFDGDGDYVTCGTDILINNSDYTIELWAKRVEDNRDDFVLMLGEASADRYGQLLYMGFKANNTFVMGANYYGYEVSTPASTDKEWHHYTLTFQKQSGRNALYRDGILVHNRTDFRFSGTGELVLGALLTKFGLGRKFCRASIDEVRIWSHAHTDAEVVSWMHRRAQGDEAGLLACWSFPAGQPTNRVKGGAAGKLYGNPRPVESPLLSAPPLAPEALAGVEAPNSLTMEAWIDPTSLPGNARIIHQSSEVSQYTLGLQGKTSLRPSALNFHGERDYLDVGTIRTLNDTDFTIEFWLYRQGPKDREVYIQSGGPQPATDRVLWLGIFGYRFCFGFYNNTLTTGGSYSDNDAWHHWAVTYNRTSRQRWIYRDGVCVASDIANTQYAGHGPTLIGAGTIGDLVNCFTRARMDEVRIWTCARTEAEIKQTMNESFTGPRPNLMACWTFPNGKLRDVGPNNYVTATTHGSPAVADSYFPEHKFQVIAGVGNRFIRGQDTWPLGTFTHVAVSFLQSWGLRLDGNTYVDAGKDDGLNLCGDLTIEVFVQLDMLGRTHGLFGKGRSLDGSGQSVPYQLAVNPDGAIVFSFENSRGQRVTYLSTAKLQAGTFYRIAVTRKAGSETEQKKGSKNYTSTDSSGKNSNINVETVESVSVKQYDDIRFYVDGVEAGAGRYDGPDPKGHNGSLDIGRILQGNQVFGLCGILGEVRLWNQARDAKRICSSVKPGEPGLLSYWRLEENTGNIARDSAGRNDARLRGARWIKNPDPQASPFQLYMNGVSSAFDILPASDPIVQEGYGTPQFTLGARSISAINKDAFVGVLEEVRIWRMVRTEEQILDNLFTRLKGEKPELIAYYSFDLDSTQKGSPMLLDGGLRGNNLPLPEDPLSRPRAVLSTAPVSNDAAQVRSAIAGVHTPFQELIDGTPAVGEYADMQRDRLGDVSGVMKRAYSFIRDNTWHLITGYKVGNLISEWVGQAQFDPQIMGFVEGAPPVPSENLTAGPVNPDLNDFEGATKVEFVQADEVIYSLSSSKDQSVTASLSGKVKNSADADVLQIIAPLGFGVATPVVKARFDWELGFNLDFENSWSSETELSQGINTERNMQVALSGLWEDPNGLLNPAMGRRWIPANMGFALVQSQTADIFSLRLSHNGALVAYRMMPNPDIPKDWNIIPFPLNPRYSKQGTLDGAVGMNERGKVMDPDYANSRGYGEYSYFKPREAYAIKRRILREQQQLQSYYEAVSTQTGKPDPTAERASQLASSFMGTQAALAQRDISSTEEAQSFARRNLVNTYVWTAEGGFFAESTQSTDSVTETAGGSYSLSGSISGSIGFDVSVFGVGIGFQFEASVGGGLSVTRSKSAEASRSFSINTEVDIQRNMQKYGENGQPVFDPAGNPVLVPGKVDAYRFLTFYLDSTKDNFDDFYNKVVDPIWLQQSDHPNAAALRGAQQSNKKPPCWRIFHRVTFISRLLPPILPPTAPPIEKAMRAEDIASNYELIRQLEPYVKDEATSQRDLANATREALRLYMPQLLPHAAEIIQYMSDYYGLLD